MINIIRLLQVVWAAVFLLAGSYSASAVATELTVSADQQPGQEVIEVKVVSVLIGGNLAGTITVKRCDECELLQFRVTPETQYFDTRNRLSKLQNARSLTGKLAGVSYVENTKVANAIYQY